MSSGYLSGDGRWSGSEHDEVCYIRDAWEMILGFAQTDYVCYTVMQQVEWGDVSIQRALGIIAVHQTKRAMLMEKAMADLMACSAPVRTMAILNCKNCGLKTMEIRDVPRTKEGTGPDNQGPQAESPNVR